MSAPIRPLLPAPPDSRVHLIKSQPKRKKVSVACEACRIRKTKCNAEQPVCSQCVKRRSKCQYVETENRKIRERYQNLRSSRSAHEELVDLMKTLPEHDAVEIFQRVRAGENAGSIVNHIKDGNLLLQLQLVPETRFRYELPYSRDIPAYLLTSNSPYLNSVLYEVASQRTLHARLLRNTPSKPEKPVFPEASTPSDYQSQYSKPYHSAVLVEPRLENAKPSDWTTVSTDDTLMRKLLSAYFIHEYHLWPVFHKDYFLEDMAIGKPGGCKTPCCSSLLVNATLAYACYCSKQIPNRFRYWEPEGIGYRFLAEARRLWEMQTINRKYRKLTTAQAALVINIVYNLYGLDKLGDSYGAQGLKIAQELRLFNGNTHIKSERIRNARNFTAWCFFNIDSHLGWQFFRPPILAKPPQFAIPDSSSNMLWYGEIWMRYPLSQTLSPTYFSHYFRAICDFRIILGELCYASFGIDGTISTQDAATFARRLLSWYEGVPEALKPRNMVLPAYFLMHLDYHMVLMILYQPFVEEEWDNEISPRELVSCAERDINVLVRLYYIRHGFQDAHVYLTAPLSKLGFMSLQSIKDDMPTEDLEYSRAGLLLALKGLREQGRNYYITRTIYYILKNQLRPEEARLLQGLEDPVVELDENASLMGEIQSAWTPRIVDISDDPTSEHLTKLAHQFLKLEPNEENENESVANSPLST